MHYQANMSLLSDIPLSSKYKTELSLEESYLHIKTRSISLVTLPDPESTKALPNNHERQLIGEKHSPFMRFRASDSRKSAIERQLRPEKSVDTVNYDGGVHFGNRSARAARYVARAEGILGRLVES